MYILYFSEKYTFCSKLYAIGIVSCSSTSGESHARRRWLEEVLNKAASIWRLASRLLLLPPLELSRLHCRLLKTSAFFSYLNPAPYNALLSLLASFHTLFLALSGFAFNSALFVDTEAYRQKCVNDKPCCGFLSLSTSLSLSLALSLSLRLREIHYSSQAVKVGHIAIAFKRAWIGEVTEACERARTRHVVFYTQRCCLH